MITYIYNPEKMGSFIENCRNSLGLSQLDVANELGITVSTVSKWENGSNQPKTEEQVLLANLFGMPVSSFMKCASNDLTVGDLYFESFINDLGNIDFNNVTNKKRFIDTYVACKQRLNYLVKQYLIEDQKISFREFERLSKAIRFGADLGDTIIIQKESNSFDISRFNLNNISFPVGEDGSGGSREIDMSDAKIINGVDYEQFIRIKESFAAEMKNQGFENWYIQGFDFELENETMKAHCTNVGFASPYLYLKADELAYLKYCIKIGLPVDNIHFYSFELGRQASELIGDDCELLESYLSSKNIRDVKKEYWIMHLHHMPTSQELEIIIKVAGEKTIYGDDVII